MEQLADLPLLYHPGTSFEYSVATDVVARLVEIISGQTFRSIHSGANSRSAWHGRHRLRGAGEGPKPARGVLRRRRPDGSDEAGTDRTDNSPYPGAYLRPVPRFNGGGGLVSTMPDMVALIRSLLPGGPTLLKPETIAAMMTNQLADGVSIRFAMTGDQVGKGIRPGGRADPAAFADRSSRIQRANSIGAAWRHAMVDIAKEEHRGRDDGAAPDVFHPSLRFPVQAAGV